MSGIRVEDLREARVWHPALFNNVELAWLADEDVLGKSPAVVRQSPLPEGVNPLQVMPVIERVYEIKELDEAGVSPGTFIGVDAIREGFKVYLEDVLAENEAKRVNPNSRRPKMGGFDLSGKFHRGLIGSDSDFVRSRFVKENGQLVRKPYAIAMFSDDTAGINWMIDDNGEVDEAASMEMVNPIPAQFEIAIDGVNGTGSIRNPIDGYTETFKLASGGPHQASWRGAWNRHRKHCMSAKDNPDLHGALVHMIDPQMDQGVAP